MTCPRIITCNVNSHLVMARSCTRQVISIVEKLLPGPVPRISTANGNIDMAMELGPSSNDAGGQEQALGVKDEDISRSRIMRFVKMLSMKMADQVRTHVAGGAATGACTCA